MNNKGFSLVELIITIAIVAILSGLSVLSFTTIYTARAQSAAITLNSKVSEVKSQTKGLDNSSKKYYAVELDISRHDSSSSATDQNPRIFISQGVYDPSDGSFVPNMVNGRYEKIKKKIASDDKTVTDPTNDEPNISSFIYVKKNGTQLPAGVYYIYFNKNGECISGDGEYEFVKRNGTVAAKTIIRKNGSHEYK